MNESIKDHNNGRYIKLFDNLSSGCGVYRVINDGKCGKDYIIEAFNKKSLEIENKTPDEVVGKSLYDLRPNIDDYGLIDIFRDVWKTGTTAYYPVRVYHDDNYSNYYENRVFRLEENVIVALYNDVTDYMQVQINLENSNKKLDMYFNDSPYGIFIADCNGNYVDVNVEACKLTGYSKSELLEMNLITLIVDEDKKSAQKAFRNLNKMSAKKVELRYVTKKGDKRIWTVKGSKLDESRYIGFVEDITKRKKLEMERIATQSMLINHQKLESIGTLASGVAHEINNPINGILNYGQLILDLNSDNKKIEEYASEIIHETSRVADIVKKLLDFSWQDVQKSSYTSIEDILSQTLPLIKAILKHDQIKLNIDLHENLPQIMCQSQKIQQVIMNLTTNARDALNAKYSGYNENKKINISCTEYTTDHHKWLKLIMEDFGVGISKESLPRIFDPFYTTKGKIQGTGLGLSISYGFIKEHHGEMLVESQEGKFARFIIKLPCDIQEEIK